MKTGVGIVLIHLYVFYVADLKIILKKCVHNTTVRSEFPPDRYEVSDGDVIKDASCIIDSSKSNTLNCGSIDSLFSELLRKSHSTEYIHEVKRVTLRDSKSEGYIPAVKSVLDNSILTSSSLRSPLSTSSELISVSNQSSTSLSSSSDHHLESSYPLPISTPNNANGSVVGEKVTEEVTYSLQHSESEASIPVKNVDSATSVYYDALESMSPTHSSIDCTKTVADSLTEQAKAIVKSVLSTVLRKLQFLGKSEQVISNLNSVTVKEGFERFPETVDQLTFATSEINIRRQGNLVIADSSKKDHSRDWLSASQPSCTPGKRTAEENLRGIKETRYSQSSPVYIPDVHVLTENMDLQSEQISGKGTNNFGDTTAQSPLNIDKNNEVQVKFFVSHFIQRS